MRVGEGIVPSSCCVFHIRKDIRKSCNRPFPLRFQGTSRLHPWAFGGWLPYWGLRWILGRCIGFWILVQIGVRVGRRIALRIWLHARYAAGVLKAATSDIVSCIRCTDVTPDSSQTADDEYPPLSQVRCSDCETSYGATSG